MDRQVAVALKYEPERDLAPKVIAKGFGFLAETIRRMAAETGVPVREDEGLARALARLSVNQEIPAELYTAVAEILAFIYRMDELAARSRS